MISELIRRVKKNNIVLEVEADRLKVHLMSDDIENDIITEIKKNKEELIKLIREGNSYVEPIPALPVQPHYAVSDGQRRLWGVSQVEEWNISYNMTESLRLEGDYNVENLIRAVHAVIERHEILRTVFKLDESGELRQWVIPKDVFDFVVDRVDLRNESDKNTLAEAYLSAHHAKPFDLENGPLLRVSLLQLADKEYLFSCNIHHIISDGWSMEVLANDIFAYYDAYQKGNTPDLSPLAIQYKDFVGWQLQKQQEPAYQDHRDYWLNQFTGEVPVLDLPTEKKRPSIKTARGRSLGTYFSKELTQEIKSYCQAKAGSLFQGLLASLYAILYRYTYQEDIVIGSPFAGRNHPQLEQQLGFYVNTLALRNQISGEDDFNAIFERTKAMAIKAIQHQDYVFGNLVEDLGLKHDLSRHPVFDILMSIQNVGAKSNGEILTDEKANQVKDLGEKTSKFDLEFTFTDSEQAIHLNVIYNEDIYEQSLIEQLLIHHQQLLTKLLASNDTPIGKINYLLREEEELLTTGFNQTAANYPTDKTIVDLFEEQVTLHPDAVALIFKNDQWTYRQLDELSNQLAHYLTDTYQITSEDLVGIKLEPSHWQVVAIVGILKAGAAYVPIDPAYPEERIEFIESDSACPVCIDENELQAFRKVRNDFTTSPVSTIANPASLAYLIYTSGTTGTPKGVMIEHRNVVRLLKTDQQLFDFNPGDVWTLFHSYCFDFSVWEIFGALLFGGKLVIVPKEVTRDPKQFTALLRKEQVTVLNQTPSSFYNIINEELAEDVPGLKLRYVIFGGEALAPIKLAAWYERYPETGLINMYGITETTVHVTYKEITEQEILANSVNIGVPIPTLSCFLLDQYYQKVPVGVPGELYVAGEGLARGYLNRPELTAERFLTLSGNKGQRLYKSGDMAKWLPTGELIYLGRNDDQVKIRGYRVELGEIEQVLLSFPEVSNAVVITKSIDEDQKDLVAYFIGRSALSVADLRTFLSDRLPTYMVPSYLVQIDEIPLTNNGKIDKSALPEPKGKASVRYVAPSTDTEKVLTEIWAEVLKIEVAEIGVLDNFFELGGHSLRATAVANKVLKTLAVEVPIKEIFTNPDIQRLSHYIDQAKKVTWSAIPKAVEKGYYQLSSAQQRLHFIHEFDKRSTVYNMPEVVRLNGALDRARLELVFNELIVRHESLRTSIEVVDGEPVQRIADHIDFKIEHYFIKSGEEQQVIDQFIRPFDLSQAPLMRVGLIEISSDEHLLLVDMHHIISDGISLGILVNDFKALYQGQKLLPLDLQYKDFAEWQQSDVQLERLAKQKAFWLAEFSEQPTVLELPSDSPRHMVDNHQGGFLGFALDPVQTQALKKLAEQEGATLFMLFLTIFKILLSKLSNQSDIVVGVPVAGRQHPDLDKIVGMFVNTLPIRNQVEGEMTFTTLLSNLKEKVLACYEHQDYAYEELVNQLNIERNTNRNPLFDVVFSYENFEENTLEIPGLALEPFNSGHAIAKFDLSLMAVEADDTVYFTFNYASNLFHQKTVERFVSYFKEIADAVIADAHTRLSAMSMIPVAEYKKILLDFNQTAKQYPRDKSIVTLFEEKARRKPTVPAVQQGRKVLTYRQLNQRANQLAHYLLKQNIKKEERIAVLGGHTKEMIVGILAVLKAGGVYLPLDRNYPGDRLNFMIENSGASIVITQKKYKHLVGDGLKIVDVENAAKNESKRNIRLAISPSDLAYVMYTSGSSGQPKGVAVIHRNVVRLVKKTNYIPFNKNTRMLQAGALGFDATTFEFWGSLLNGGQLIFEETEVLLDPALLKKALKKQAVNTMLLTPALFNQHALDHADLFAPLRYLIVGGDVLNPQFIYKVKQAHPHLKIVNAYGPTENGTISTSYEVGKRFRLNIPIGKPIHNSTAYIFNKDGQLQPLGVPGELCVGGDGVARGYLGNDDLTREKFVENPYVPGEIIYKTGDLAKWLPDGNIEFLGRMDNQVKIRGFRVEVGEIESHIAQYEQIQEVLVLVNKEQGDSQLVAYYVAEAEIPPGVLRNFLSGKLPEYMIPMYFLHLQNMPITSNGKVDKKALPAPKWSEQFEYVAPTNATEKELVDIWSEVLSIEPERIGIQDNFFRLGGHSIAAMRVISTIKKQLAIEIGISEIFARPTISGLANFILTETHGSNLPKLEVQTRPTHIPLSYAQERLWIIDQLQGSVHYHIPEIIELDAEVDQKLLAQTIQAVVNRHEILRTIYKKDENGEVYQEVLSEDQFELTVTKLPVDMDESGQEELIETAIMMPFDLSKDHMIRAHFFDRQSAGSTLVLVVHHIATDGWSMAILKRELVELYTAQTENRLPQMEQLPIQYADYAIWQRFFLTNDALSEKVDYWANKLKGIEPLNFPLDFPRQDLQTTRGLSLKTIIDKPLADKLQEFSTDKGGTLFMTLLSAFKVLLYRYTKQVDICVGTAIANRTQKETESLIGLFLNTLALRTDLGGNPSFSELLDRVKTTTLDAYSNQDVPFEKVLEVVNPERYLNRTPFFQVFFNMLNQPEIGGSEAELNIDQGETHTTESKFDITFYANMKENGLHIDCAFNHNLLRPETIDNLLKQYVILLEQIVAQPDRSIGNYNLLVGDQEVQQLQTRFGERPAFSILDLIEKQVTKEPEATALVDAENSYTYQQLWDYSSGIAELIQEKGVRKGESVIIFGLRNSVLPITLLGAIKSGAVYTIFSKDYPHERIEKYTQLLHPRLIIDLDVATPADSLMQQWQENQIEVLSIDSTQAQWHQATGDKGRYQPVSYDPTGPMYQMLTSGTTGIPKVVEAHQSSVVNYVNWQKEVFKLDKEDRFSMLSGLMHDPLFRDIFVPLSVGGTLCIPTQEIMATDKLAIWLQEQEVSVMNITPSLALVVVMGYVELPAMRYIFYGGEALNTKVVNVFKMVTPNAEQINLYGATETQQALGFHKIAPEDVVESKVPLGKGLLNTDLVVFNDCLLLAGVGELGEIAIRSPYLALGYKNDREFTAQRFIPNPYTNDTDDLFYLTGDLGRYLTDGSVAYVGRSDNQVNIRGNRVVLEEIRLAMLQEESIVNAVVDVREMKEGELCLVAFVQCVKAVEVATVRQKLSGRLPRYMVPTQLVILDELPVNHNGKADRVALAKIEVELNTKREYVPARSEVEASLVAIWEEMLGIDKIGVHDNFFEMGGHSLLAIQLISRINNHFKTNLAVTALFDQPTIDLFVKNIPQSVSLHNLSMPVLAKLNSGQRTPAFFCSPAISGHLSYFSELKNQIGDQLDFYGFRAVGLDGVDVPLQTIHQMAKANIEEMQKVDPTGPYFIGGYSFGARIAYEMALELELRGFEVYRLVIFDIAVQGLTINRILDDTNSYEQHLIDWTASYAGKWDKTVNIDEQTLQQLSREDQYDLIRRKLKDLEIEVTNLFIKGYSGVWINNYLLQYDPDLSKKVKAPITVFKVASNEEEYGWETLTTNTVDTIELPGNHNTIIKEPRNAQEIVKVLKGYTVPA